MTPTYKRIVKSLNESQINKYHQALIGPWFFMIITLLMFVLYGWTILNKSKDSFLLVTEMIGIFVSAGITISLWIHKESKLNAAIKPLELEGIIQYKAIPILIDEIDKFVAWTKTFMYLLTIAFFAINAFVSYLGLHLSMIEPFFEKDKKDLLDITNQTESTLLHTTTFSFEVSLVATIIVVIVLMLTIYETALSKRKFVKLCLRETYYNDSGN